MVTLATAKVFLKVLYPPLISLITSVLFCALQIPGPSVWKGEGIAAKFQKVAVDAYRTMTGPLEKRESASTMHKK
jgi:hypothetical protein